jgi:hypothetical protein
MRITRHACGDWMLLIDGVLVAQLPTFDEASKRAEVETNEMRPSLTAIYETSVH